MTLNLSKYFSERHRLKRYGITTLDLITMLERQQYKCLGCRIKIENDSKTHVDHDHKTGVVRGLLCMNCNRALGHVHDDPKVLYNLTAYLERKPNKKYVYLIGSLRNTSIPLLGNKLREIGYEVFDEWHGAGPTADDSWQEYSKTRGMNYKEALESIGAQHVFNFDRSHIEMSDIGVLLMPAGKSGHLELGYMVGLGKPTYIVFDKEPDRYDVMPNFANTICLSETDFITKMKDK